MQILAGEKAQKWNGISDKRGEKETAAD